MIFVLPAEDKKTNQSNQPKADMQTYKSSVKPLLEKYCFECHGPKKSKGELRLDTLNPDLLNGDDAEKWREVLDAIIVEDMPPKKASQPTGLERNTIVNWFSGEFKKAVESSTKSKTHTSFRRMTRYEHEFTLSDLIGVPVNVEEDLPEDLYSKEGFLNNSGSLFFSPSQIQAYQKIAFEALNKAIFHGPRPESKWYSVSVKRPENPKGRFTGLSMSSSSTKPAVPNPHAGVGMYSSKRGGLSLNMGVNLPDNGIVRVRMRITKTKPGKSILIVKFGYWGSHTRFDDEEVAKFVVDGPVGKPTFYEFYMNLRDVPRNPYRKFDNNAIEAKGIKKYEEFYVADMSPDSVKMGKAVSSKKGFLPVVKEKKKKPSKKGAADKKSNKKPKVKSKKDVAQPSSFSMDYMEVQTNVYDEWPPVTHKNIFISSANSSNKNVYAREVIANFMARAYCRPIEKSEIEEIYTLYEMILKDKGSFEEAIVKTLSVILSLPEFVYLFEDDSATGSDLVNYKLASRLSYFLWCSLPDNELLKLAKAGTLTDSKVLSAQVKRMLADPKSKRFSDQYAYQWLDVDKLKALCVDTKIHTKFNDSLKKSMAMEPLHFFNEVLKNNMSILTFIDSDFAMLDSKLSAHYGIKGFNGNGFQKIKISPDRHRGGVLTQASFLAGASDGVDSHPIKRGLWLLERILGDTPPPPPGNVQALDEDDPSLVGLTLKKKLEQHRDREACRDCHNKIDPWGVVFENYSAVGAWRTSITRDKIKKTNVDSSVILSDDTSLKGIEDLKKHLLTEKKDKFTRSFVDKMCSYVMGRTLGYADREHVDNIYSKFKESDYKLSDLLHIIVLSDFFKSK